MKTFMKAPRGKVMEASLIWGLPALVKTEIGPGRLRNQCEKLMDITEKDLKAMGALTDPEKFRCTAIVNEFGRLAGWHDGKHTATMASFCLDMIENSKYHHNPKAVEILGEIMDYYDRAGKVPGPSCWSGAVAAEKWRKVMEAA